MKTALVVPTIREKNIVEFLKRWDLIGEQWDQIIVVEDNPTKTFDLTDAMVKVDHVSWQEIEADLGKDAWIISRRDSAIRSYGFLKAYREGADFIFTLDDDCFAVDPRTTLNSFVHQHIENLTNTPKWIESIPGQRTRGLPYKNLGKAKNVVLSVGLWEGVPDFDAIQTLSGADQNITLSETRVLPVGQYTPICGMNLGFKREIAPLMYFPLQGEGYEYRRFDDIWFGIICKKICDHLGSMITCGRPYIHHSKASDPFVNLVKEAPGIKANETFWEEIDNIKLSGTDPRSCMIEIGDALYFNLSNSPYLHKLGIAMKLWAFLFS